MTETILAVAVILITSENNDSNGSSNNNKKNNNANNDSSSDVSLRLLLKCLLHAANLRVDQHWVGLCGSVGDGGISVCCVCRYWLGGG